MTNFFLDYLTQCYLDLMNLVSWSRILSSISYLNVPEDVNLFPAKMYPWFPDPDEKPSVLQALEYTIEQGGSEWYENRLLVNHSLIIPKTYY